MSVCLPPIIINLETGGLGLGTGVCESLERGRVWHWNDIETSRGYELLMGANCL